MRLTAKYLDTHKYAPNSAVDPGSMQRVTEIHWTLTGSLLVKVQCISMGQKCGHPAMGSDGMKSHSFKWCISVGPMHSVHYPISDGKSVPLWLSLHCTLKLVGHRRPQKNSESLVIHFNLGYSFRVVIWGGHSLLTSYESPNEPPIKFGL